MFDFSTTGIALAFAGALFHALSPAAMGTIGASLGLVLLAWTALPAGGRAIALGLAAGLGVFGALWQTAAADGARREIAHTHALALAAERERAALAEGITRDLAEQSTRDLAEAQADTLHVKGLNDVLARDPRLQGVCLPRDIARRLRAL